MKTFTRSALSIVVAGVLLLTVACSNGGGSDAKASTTIASSTTAPNGNKPNNKKSTNPQVIAYCKARQNAVGKINLKTPAGAKASLPYVKAVADAAPPAVKASNAIMLATITQFAAAPANTDFTQYKQRLTATLKFKNAYKTILKFSNTNC